jgi:hypothetical protein
MAISTRQRIINELNLLRTRRMDMGPDEKLLANEKGHQRINELLDQLESETQSQCKTQSQTKPVRPQRS